MADYRDPKDPLNTRPTVAPVRPVENIHRERTHAYEEAPLYAVGGDHLAAVEHASISWRAIFAGFFIAMLTYFVLTALGFAIGGTTLRGVVQGNNGLQAFGIGSAIWLIVTALVSLFIGSYFAGRVAGMIPTRVGGAQGLVVTALFFAFVLAQVGSAVGMVGSGVGSAFKAMGGAAGDLASNPEVQDTVNNAMGNMNLKSPPDEVAKRVATLLLQGKTDQAANYLSAQAGITREEADQKMSEASATVQAKAKEIGSKAASIASIAGWTVFGMLTLGCIFSYLGGAAGARVNLRRPLSRSDERTITHARAA